VPVYQGTSDQSCYSIGENGFGAVASRDEGFYGRG